MLRRQFLLAASSGLLHAQNGAAVDYRDYSRCLPDFLARLAREHAARRSSAIAALRTLDAIRAHQRRVRETFWKITGGEPERAPLNARVTGSLERAHWKIEKVVYESRPGFHIPANLYLPKTGKPPYPGVLFQMGHALNGKAASSYQYCCQGLVQLGFVVLAFDPMGQGERTYYANPETGLTRLPSADDEHTVPGKQLLLVGDTSTRLQTWDAVRSLDYLASHPLVDANRLASTGNSGGGTLTMLLAAVDSRLACAAVASGNTENHAIEAFNSPGSTDDAEQNFLTLASGRLDRWDVLYPLAPKPLLVLASSKDWFGTYSPAYISDGRREFERLRGVYGVMGHANRIGWHETPLPHGLSPDLRIAIYNWFRRWLQGVDKPLDAEPPVKAEEDRALWVGATGNAVRDFTGKSPHGLARDLAASIRTPARPSTASLAELLAIAKGEAPATFRSLGRTESRECAIETSEAASAPEVHVPVWIFHPRRPRPEAPVLVMLDPRGRNASWNEDALCQQLAARGVTVVASDVRGVGDLAPEYPRQSPRHAAWHQDEDAYAWASLMLGAPLLGQRVTDLLAVVAAAHARFAGRPVAVAARGHLTVTALFAAALRPDAIASLHCEGALVSFRSLVEVEKYEHAFGSFVFGMLRHADLPELAASAAPRRIRMSRLLDAAGAFVEAARARQTYASPNVELMDQSLWNVESLSRL